MANQQFNIKQIKEIIKFSLDASKESDFKLPVCLWGVHGVGKTEIVKQVADELDYNLVILHLAMQDICDLIGIPSKIEYELPGGEKEVVQIWSCPQWLHNANENYKKTGKPNLFFLDEFNRGNRFVLSAMLPFLIEGVLHQHHIGPNDAVISAANPATDKYEVNELTDEALLNRLAHVIFKPTHAEYVEYLKKKGIDQTTVKVVEANPSYTKITDFDLGFDVKPSRRSIYNVMRLVGKKPQAWIDAYGTHVIEAYLGAAFRDEWHSTYLKREDTITLEMLQDYANTKSEIVRMLTTNIDKQTTHRTDVLSKAIDVIKTYIKDRGNSLDKTDVEWMTEFFSLSILPDDAGAAVFMGSPELKTAILRNADINIAVTNYLIDHNIIEKKKVDALPSSFDAQGITTK